MMKAVRHNEQPSNFKYISNEIAAETRKDDSCSM